MRWIDVGQDTERWQALVSRNDAPGSRKCGDFLTSWRHISFWRRTLLYI